MKITEFQRELKRRAIDVALISSFQNRDPNLRYFIGIDLEYSVLIVPKQGAPTLITSRLEQERATRFSEIARVVTFKKPALAFIAGLLKKYGRNIGINKSVMSLSEFKSLRKAIGKRHFVDIATLLVSARKHKHPKEVATLRRACAAADSIFRALIKDFRFRTERDVAEFLRTEAERMGHTLSFEPIVASGTCSSMPHYRGREVKLRKGFCVIDFGVDVDGYKSDITRTIYLGTASKQEKESYAMLQKVQSDCIALIRPGMKAAALATFVNEQFSTQGQQLIHGLGHGIGVEIHELPSIVAGSRDIITDGDVFTIEPGIYYPGKFGIRIEDDILIQGDRVIVLTKSARYLIEVK
jgi:Xaa-Pro aminopeptidase